MLSSGNHPVKTLLTLSATTQRSAIAHAIRSFSAARPVGAVLTKIDESCVPGWRFFIPYGERNLSLCFHYRWAAGPEDLHIARSQLLVNQAMELSKTLEETPDGRLSGTSL